jgi:hypothetical protein
MHLHVMVLCANCHRRVHYGKDGKKLNKQLKKRLRELKSLRTLVGSPSHQALQA